MENQSRKSVPVKKSMAIFKEGISDLRKGFIVLFGLIFVGVISYWIYETWYIYSTDVGDIGQAADVSKAVAHQVAAYQASILSFLVLAFLYVV